jgi:N-hydroxyarylamine O-acetyltransferase
MSPLTDSHRRYLRLLELDQQPVSLDYLREIVFQQVCRVPFENLSKLLLVRREGDGRVITLDEYLDGIEHHDLGGTCYTCNPFLVELLHALGFEASLLGADMSVPNIHTSIRVRLDGRGYHVDAGYGGPFREPLCIDQFPESVHEGGTRYVFDRVPQSKDIQVTQFSSNGRVHGYRAHGPARNPEFFRPIVLDSFAPGKTFMSCLRIVRIFPGHSVELHDRSLTVHDAGESRTVELASMDELREAVADQFAMPRCPVEEAVATLEILTGRHWFEPA